MELKALARLFIKGAGLLVIVLATNRLPYNLVSSLAGSAISRIWVGALLYAPVFALILIGLALILRAETIVARAFAAELGNPHSSPDNMIAIEDIAVSVLGIYLLSAAVADGAYYLHVFLTNRPVANQLSYIDLFYGFGARFLIGVALTLGSRHIAVLHRRIVGLRPMKNELEP